jgi:cytochrome c biogenesis protein CcdA
MATNESTPLLPGRKASASVDQKKSFGDALRSFFTSVENRILAAGFLICVAFSFTQVPCVLSPFSVTITVIDVSHTNGMTAQLIPSLE